MKKIQTLAEVEREAIIRALARFQGNRTEVAKQLGISPRTLRNKLSLYVKEGALVPTPTHDRYYKCRLSDADVLRMMQNQSDTP